MTTAVYQVTGMTCEHCVRAVTVTSDSPLTTEAVEAALDEAGEYRLVG